MYRCKICGEIRGPTHHFRTCNAISNEKFREKLQYEFDLDWNMNYPVTGERVW